ncbi:MAG: adenylate/guanylate cyclase domain-containing protein, partial [Saprospiraceae bacterium]|nr:adenylate/guanylate cyclase domain-containing protein [Saprospiraceae bacterium]
MPDRTGTRSEIPSAICLVLSILPAMRQTRQLAAIMFTDIAGYTTMMGKAEQKTLALIKANKQIHLKWLKVYRGKWLKEAGDGIMASFASVSDAIYCA